MNIGLNSNDASSKSPAVAIFTDTFDQINGVATTYQKLVCFCQKHAKRLDIFTYGERDTVEEQGTVRIIRSRPLLPIAYYSDMSFDFCCLRRRILRYCRESGCQLIQTATPGSMGLNAFYAARKMALPLVGVYHTALPEYVDARRRQLVRKLLLSGDCFQKLVFRLSWRYISWYYHHCKVVLVPSQPVREQLAEKVGVPTELFTRGVDSQRFHPEYWKPRSRVTALYVGRVSEEKNLRLLTKLFKSRSDVELVVVGDGPYRPEMESDLPDAQFAGFLRGQDLSEAYASADFFVFPSDTDTFGNVVLEAMSSGLPVLVSSGMGPKGLVTHGRNGFVCENKREFSDRINLLVSNAELRLKMGREARAFALTQSWDNVFFNLFRVYTQILEQAAAPTLMKAAGRELNQSWEVTW